MLHNFNRFFDNGSRAIDFWKIVLIFVLYLILPLSTLAQTQLSRSTLPLTLNQHWQYHAGDESFTTISQRPTWETIGDSQWRGNTFPKSGWQGVGWLRLDFEITPDLVEVPLALMVRHIGASEIYLDRKLIARHGKVHRNKEIAFNPQGQPILLLLKKPGIHTLFIRYSCTAIRGDLGNWRSAWWAAESTMSLGIPMGPRVELDLLSPALDGYQSQQVFAVSEVIGLSGFLLTFTALYLFLYIFNAQDKSNFYMGLLAGSLLCNQFLSYLSFNNSFGFEIVCWIKIINAVVSIALYLVILLFVSEISFQKILRWPLVLIVYLVCVNIIRFNPGTTWFFPMAYLIFLVTFFGTILFMIIQAIQRKVAGIWIIAVAIGFGFIGIAVEGLKVVGFSPQLARILIDVIRVIFFLCLSFYLAQRTARVTRNLAELNLTLEQKVVQRTLELQKSEERFQLIAQANRDLLWDWDLEANTLWFNGGYESNFGYDQEVGLDIHTNLDWWKAQIHPEDLIQVLAFNETVRQSKTGEYRLEYRFRKADQSYVFVLDEAIILRNDQGNPIRMVGAIKDYSATKKAEQFKEEALKQTLAREYAEQQIREFQKINDLKDEFLSTVSHELRTPLSNMSIAINLLQRNPDSNRREVYIQTLMNECAREKSLINNLLDLQRLEVTTTLLNIDELNLHTWLLQVLEPFYERTQSRQQTLMLTSDATSGLVLSSDYDCLERIVVELIHNACKYTPERGQIIVSVVPNGAQIQLCILNTGVTIPPASLPRIFDKFYRVPSSDPWRQGGTGLGLALVQKLVHQLQGTIKVTSEEGQTCFTITLPQIEASNPT